MLDGAPLVGREGLSRPFSDSRDDGVLGVLPAVGVAKMLEFFVPVLSTGRAETPDPEMASHEAGGRLITGGIGIIPAPDGIHPQGIDPLGETGCHTGCRDHMPDVGQFRQGEHRQGINGTFGQQRGPFASAGQPEPAKVLP